MDPDFPNDNQAGQQSPQQTFQPSMPQNPQSPGSPKPNSESSYGGNLGSGSNNTTKKLFIIIGALIGLLVIIAIIAFAFSGNNGNTPENQAQEEVNGEFYVKEPVAVDVESVNNSISDDISGLDTDADFPEDNLSDLNLGL